ncbi:EamA family transporter RarD [Massilia sp. TS11]|uniref:EamA family transporter RarD n=1 Tax=Massilia sp. TS11 TaxID=2908003 RepID=UPI001EDB2BB5|nr:EamA family transporter RarD [Massilia sp. TS11]MCG2585747.1 EamA family transporter RarD [Massilia sp. TS11]
MRTGVLYGGLAFVIWGLFPLYFHLIAEVPALQILAHRVLWCLLFLAGVLAVRRQWAWLPGVLARPRVLANCAGSALLLAANWFIYIWAINNGHVLDASLGYFINPLVNVLLGYVLLHERMRPAQWAAVGLAAAGVLWLAIQAGHMPWIALALALSFGFYGLMRKTAALGALEGLTIETLALFPLAAGYLLWQSAAGTNVFANADWGLTRWVLIGAGPVTAVPLLLFAAGARRIPLSLLGLLQYVAPTMVFLTGTLLFHEPFSSERLVGFLVIWAALALYAGEGLWRRRA